MTFVFGGPGAQSVRAAAKIVCIFLFALILASFTPSPPLEEDAALGVNSIGGEQSSSANYQVSDRLLLLMSSANQSSADYRLAGSAAPDFDIVCEASASYWELLD